MPTDQTQNLTLRKFVSNQKGFILIAALTLLTVLTLLGTTAYILSSTDIRVGGNFRDSQLALQVAMAGSERARQIIREANATSTNSASFSEELAALVGANSTLNDPLSTTDDVVYTSGTMNNVSYVAYVTNDPQEPPVPTGWLSTTDSNKRALITSIATGPNNSRAIVQTVVEVFPMVSSPAAVYTKGDIGGNGNALTIDGNDACNGGTNLNSAYAMGEWDPSGNPKTYGSPDGVPVEHGTTDLDIAGMISQLKGSADYTLTEDLENATYGSETSYKTVYSNTSSPVNPNGLTLNNVKGWGILIVEGDLNLGGGFTWNGIILATGSVTLNGGGGPNAINIQGQLLSGTSTVTDVTLNGSNTITYNSCNVKKATAQAPLNVVSWKQNY